jgi:hypothetical protein
MDLSLTSAGAELCYTDTDTCISIEADTDTAIRHFPKKNPIRGYLSEFF